MKKHQWWLALAAVGLLALALPAHGQVGADGTKYTAATGTRLIGVRPDSTQKLIKASATGGLSVSDESRDRDLDFGVTNLISSVAIDSGGTGGANFRYSAPLDVRKWSSGNIIIHITAFGAGDTVGTYDYGVTLYALTSATADWATVGVPVVTNGMPTVNGMAGANVIKGAVASRDSSGFWNAYPTPVENMTGERFIRLQTNRGNSNYRNSNAAQTVSLPWSYWFGLGFRPRYLMAQVRLASKTTANAGTPSVRMDVEGLR